MGLSSSKANVALLQGTGIKPGDSVTGIVTLTNKGDRAGKLGLSITGVHDTRASTAAASRACCSCASTTSPPAGAPVQTTLARTGPRARRPQGPPVPHLQGHRDVPRHRPAARPDPGRQRPAGLERRGRAGLEHQREGPGRAGPPIPSAPTPAPPVLPPGQPPRLVMLRVPAQSVIEPRKLKVCAACELRCKLKFSASDRQRAEAGQDGPQGQAAPRDHARKHVINRRTKRWVTLKKHRQARSATPQAHPEGAHAGSSRSCTEGPRRHHRDRADALGRRQPRRDASHRRHQAEARLPRQARQAARDPSSAPLCCPGLLGGWEVPTTISPEEEAPDEAAR